MKKLSKSVDEYLRVGGWSSSLFFDHACSLFTDPDLKALCTFEVGRTVVYLRNSQKFLKAYVHHNGRNRQYLTFTTESGKEVKTFHYMDNVTQIKQFLITYLENV
jgi:hypothetical protein